MNLRAATSGRKIFFGGREGKRFPLFLKKKEGHRI